MDFLNILLNSGNGNLIDKVANQTNTDSDSAKGITGVVEAELINQIKNKIAGNEDSSEIENAINNHNYDDLVDNPDKIDAIKNEGGGVLDKILSSDSLVDNLATNISQKSGIDITSIKDILPMLAPVVLGTISKGKELEESDTNDTPNSQRNSLLSMLDRNNDGRIIDDIFDMAKSLFNK